MLSKQFYPGKHPSSRNVPVDQFSKVLFRKQETSRPKLEMTMLPSSHTKTIRVHNSNIRGLAGSAPTHSLQTRSAPARKGHSCGDQPQLPPHPTQSPRGSHKTTLFIRSRRKGFPELQPLFFFLLK